MHREGSSPIPARRARPALVAAALAALGTFACAGTGKFIWVEDIPKTMLAPENPSVLGPGDVIGVRVWNQEANSVDRARIRDDGKISMPLLNDVEVAGMQPSELARRIEVKLKPFIVNPVVTVVLQEHRGAKVAVVGRVTRPGVYELDDGSGVMDALAMAGGLTPFADEEKVFVLRKGYWADGNPSPARIRFRYTDLRRGSAPAAVFTLRRGDTVVVE